MKHLVFLFVLAALLILPAQAQDSTITFSATADYNGDLPKTVKGAAGILKSHEVVPGAEVAFSPKLAGIFHINLTLDYAHKPGNTLVSFAGGPEVVFGKSNQLFAHALIGGAKQEQTAKVQVLELADSSFVYFVGGGYRHFVSKHFGVAATADYGYSQVFRSSENLWKIGAGLVARF